MGQLKNNLFISCVLATLTNFCCITGVDVGSTYPGFGIKGLRIMPSKVRKVIDAPTSTSFFTGSMMGAKKPNITGLLIQPNGSEEIDPLALQGAMNLNQNLDNPFKRPGLNRPGMPPMSMLQLVDDGKDKMEEGIPGIISVGDVSSMPQMSVSCTSMGWTAGSATATKTETVTETKVVSVTKTVTVNSGWGSKSPHVPYNTQTIILAGNALETTFQYNRAVERMTTAPEEIVTDSNVDASPKGNEMIKEVILEPSSSFDAVDGRIGTTHLPEIY